MPASQGVRSLHYGSPVNWDAPLNRGLVTWWTVLPLRSGRRYWRELVRQIPGALTNMGSSSAVSGWGAPTRPGSGGELRFDGTDDYVDLSTLRVLFTTTLGYTWTFWLKPRVFTEWHSLFGFLTTAGAAPCGHSLTKQIKTSSTGMTVPAPVRRS